MPRSQLYVRRRQRKPDDDRQKDDVSRRLASVRQLLCPRFERQFQNPRQHVDAQSHHQRFQSVFSYQFH